MIHAVCSAHLTAEDNESFSLLINKEPLGKLTAKNRNTLIIHGRSDVSMMIGIWHRGHKDDRLVRSVFSDWRDAVTELQTKGLSFLLPYMWNKKPIADFLVIVCREGVMIWNSRRRGVYLRRGSSLFRVQPAKYPGHIFPEYLLRYCDFFAITPRAGDEIFMLPPEYLAGFETEWFISNLIDNDRLPTAMQNLISVSKAAGREDHDVSWMGIQINDIRDNKILEENMVASLRPNTEVRLQMMLRERVPYSKIFDIRGGDFLNQKLRDQARIPITARRPVWADLLKDNKASRRRYAEGVEAEKSKYKDIPSGNDIINPGMPVPERRARSSPFVDDNEEDMIERFMNYSTDNAKDRIKDKALKIFNLMPERPLFSKFFGMMIIAACLIFAFSIFKIFTGTKDKMPVKKAESRAEAADEEDQFVEDGEAAPVPKNLPLEVERIVGENSLQVRMAPRSSSPVITTLKEGDKLMQLTEAIDGFIYVRLESGQYGYVYAEYLEENR